MSIKMNNERSFFRYNAPFCGANNDAYIFSYNAANISSYDEGYRLRFRLRLSAGFS